MASVKQRDNGKWRARYRDEAGREHARHFATKREGQRWVDEQTAKLITGTYVDPRAGTVSLSAFYADWAPRQVWEPLTEVAMSVAVRGCTFVDIELRKVKRSHVEAWVKSMQVRGLAASTIRTRVNNVRAVLRAAVRDKVIAEDPAANVTLPRVRKAEHAIRIPTPEELRAILEASESWFVPFVALCAFGGLRLGEAAAVQSADVDYLRRQLHIRRQVQRQAGGAVRISPPKYGSERTIVAPDSLLELLSRHVRDIGVYGDEGWMFAGDRGNPPHQNTVHYRWKTTTAAAGIEGVRLHDLRHFYASGLIAAGCDVVTVQRALGHARPTTTLNTYSHLWPDAEDRTRSAAAGLIAAVYPDSADSSRTAGL